jgi:hypothetical protein
MRFLLENLTKKVWRLGKGFLLMRMVVHMRAIFPQAWQMDMADWLELMVMRLLDSLQMGKLMALDILLISKDANIQGTWTKGLKMGKVKRSGLMVPSSSGIFAMANRQV